MHLLVLPMVEWDKTMPGDNRGCLDLPALVDPDSLRVSSSRPENGDLDFPLPDPQGLEIAQVSALVQTDALATGRRMKTHAPQDV